MTIHVRDNSDRSMPCPACGGPCKEIGIGFLLEQEVREEAESENLRSFGSCKISWKDGFEKGAYEFTKRTEERISKEIIEWMNSEERKSLPYNGILPNHKMWAEYLEAYLKWKGYIK